MSTEPAHFKTLCSVREHKQSGRNDPVTVASTTLALLLMNSISDVNPMIMAAPAAKQTGDRKPMRKFALGFGQSGC
jgi:hypothetical protein